MKKQIKADQTYTIYNSFVKKIHWSQNNFESVFIDNYTQLVDYKYNTNIKFFKII